MQFRTATIKENVIKSNLNQAQPVKTKTQVVITNSMQIAIQSL